MRRLVCLPLLALLCNAAAARTIQLRTTEVTDAEVAPSPDGQSLVFTMLGHLFRLPATGGTAEQLTFGPYYDSSPVFSPDGSRLAFLSDRDGSGGNVFVLDLVTERTVQRTHEPRAASPRWSPDGRTIAYLRVLAREEHPPDLAPGFGGIGLGESRSIPEGGGDATVLGPPKLIRALFYLPDGRLAWTVGEFGAGRGGFFRAVSKTRIEALAADGTTSTLRSVDGDLGLPVPAPTGDALFYVSTGQLARLPLPEGEVNWVADLPSHGAAAQFQVTADGKSLYYGGAGQLWRIALPDGQPQAVPFRAEVKLDIRDPVSPIWQPRGGDELARARLSSVLTPRLSPDGRTLVFMAAGYLWQQPLAGGPAQRLFQGDALELDPAFSPDGRQLAFVRSEHGNRELCVFDFESDKVRTILSLGDGSWALSPSFSSDGERLVFQRSDAIFAPFALTAVRLSDGTVEKLADAAGGWTPRPHFSADGASLYFTSRTGSVGALFRMSLNGTTTPQAVTQLDRHARDALVSPDGKWLAFRRNTEIWMAPLASERIREEHARRISPEGGGSFAFTPDSAALIYAAAARVWRQPLDGSQREEIPVHLQVKGAVPPPLLLRRVRVLNFGAGGFGTETSVQIADGRIQSIGAAHHDAVPKGVVVLDAAGRYLIPGLFDLHVHSAWRNQQANHDALLAYGITSVRDTGGSLDLLSALADRSELTNGPMPRFFYSGEIFEGAQPLWGDAFLQIESEEDARAHVRRWKQWGAHFIKVYPSLPWPLQRVVADEAHRLNLPMVGHGLSTEEIVKSVTLGYAVLEHGAGSIEDDLLHLLAAAGTTWDPTLAITGGGLLLASEPQRREDPRFRTFVPADSIRAARGGGLGSRFPIETRRAMWKAQLGRIWTAHERGVKLRAGTDSLMTGVFFGPSLHWELEHLVEAGLSPLEALRIATAEAAQTVGAADHLGTVEPGKLADLVLLDADPLQDIRNTQTIWRVVKGGAVLDPTHLRSKPDREPRQ